MAKKIRVHDTTLRDGEQTPGVTILPEDKVLIAKALDELGVDVIEAGSAITSEGEQEGIRLIAKEKLNAEISSFARIVRDDVDKAMKCGVNSIFLVAPTSDLHIQYKLGIDRKELLRKTVDVVEYCKDHGLVVDLCTEDGSRTDLDFLEKVLKESTSAGADRFTVADTVGIMTPDKMSAIFARLSKTAKIPLGVHCHDDLGLATAKSPRALDERGRPYRSS